MTRHRQQFTRDGAGYAFNSAKTRALASATKRLAQENATRVPCPICQLRVLPGALHVHMEIAHGED